MEWKMAHRLAGCNTSVGTREGDGRERIEVKCSRSGKRTSLLWWWSKGGLGGASTNGALGGPKRKPPFPNAIDRKSVV